MIWLKTYNARLDQHFIRDEISADRRNRSNYIYLSNDDGRYKYRPKFWLGVNPLVLGQVRQTPVQIGSAQHNKWFDTPGDIWCTAGLVPRSPSWLLDPAFCRRQLPRGTDTDTRVDTARSEKRVLINAVPRRCFRLNNSRVRNIFQSPDVNCDNKQRTDHARITRRWCSTHQLDTQWLLVADKYTSRRTRMRKQSAKTPKPPPPIANLRSFATRWSNVITNRTMLN